MQSVPPADNPQQLPISISAKKVPKKLALVPLIFLIYFEVAGGPYGEEPTVQAAGPLFALLGFSIFPLIWGIPQALVTAELSTAYPGNGGFVIWAERAFGPFFGSLMGSWKFLSLVINMATFPVLCITYVEKVLPVLGSGWPRNLAIFISTLVLSIVNYTGVTNVGYAAVLLGIVSLSPFVVMSVMAIPKIHPHRWLRLGQKGVKKDWNLFFNTLSWNLNFWDNISTLAGEVDRPTKTLPLALFSAVILTSVSYVIPLFAVIGAVSVDQSEWGPGFHATAAGMIAGKWLKYWMEVGAVLSVVGLFEAQLSSSAYQLLGMADLGMLPKFFAIRSKWFNTPWFGDVAGVFIFPLVEKEAARAGEALQNSDEAAGFDCYVLDTLRIFGAHNGHCYQDSLFGEWFDDSGRHCVCLHLLSVLDCTFTAEQTMVVVSDGLAALATVYLALVSKTFAKGDSADSWTRIWGEKDQFSTQSAYSSLCLSVNESVPLPWLTLPFSPRHRVGIGLPSSLPGLEWGLFSCYSLLPLMSSLM
ncbi:hypothetical protein Tsubulata_015379 [Turnera subulata]|uniref:Amino acid permease/ SLC12A domain-containing protein n=1 Tax=Turnera subulata TaxID=218843 RepID=A0A9Q0JLV8_9ROSI|nr:hypothetical protein Tsubulata_015379 [Turnera subulata]